MGLIMIPRPEITLPYRIEHSHTDGTSHPMDKVDDPTEHDAERTWGLVQLFKCRSCDETVSVIPEDEG